METIDLTNVNLNISHEMLEQISEQIQETPHQPHTRYDIPTFDVRDLGWENISTVVPNNVDAALKTANLDWNVLPRPVYVDGEPVTGRFANVRSDLPPGSNVLEIVGSKYKIVQNREALSFVQDIIDTGEIKLENAGSFNGGRTIFLLAKTEGLTVAGDKIQPYVIFSNSHDGTSSVQVALTTIRVVCQNTLSLALHSAPRKWSLTHTESITERMKAAAESMNFIGNYLTQFPVEIENMKSRYVSNQAFERITNTLFPIPAQHKTNTRLVTNAKIANQMFRDIYNNTADIQPHIDTALGVYNAYTDYMSHVKPKRTSRRFEENRFIRNAIIGRGMERAQHIIMTTAATV